MEPTWTWVLLLVAGGAEPAQNDPADADSATTGSVSREGFGRLVGEQLAYAWFEAVVARGEEP